MTFEDTNVARAPLAGSTLAGRYRLVRLIGSGGMADVYEGVHTWTERRVAVKVLRTGHGGTGGVVTPEPATMERFLAEARAASRTRHPRVVEVLDMGRDSATGAVFMVQELLDGENLRALLRRRGSLPPGEALGLLEPLLDALATAHEAGVIHRDVKPENIFVESRPEGSFARLIDFGIARLHEADAARVGVTRTGAVVGTAGYMSPEQARGESDLDARTDVWAMGVVLYEVLTGAAPFVGTNYNDVIAQVLTRRAPSLREVIPSVPVALAEAIDRSLEPDRTRRHPTMRAFAASLPPSRDVSRPPAEPLPQPRRTLRLFAALAALLITILGVVAIVRRAASTSLARPAAAVATRPTPRAVPTMPAVLATPTPPPSTPAAPTSPAPTPSTATPPRALDRAVHAVRRVPPPRIAAPPATVVVPRNGAVLIPP